MGEVTHILRPAGCSGLPEEMRATLVVEATAVLETLRKEAY